MDGSPRASIRVEESLKDVEVNLVWGEPKSDASRRTVSIPNSVFELLKQHLDEVVSSSDESLVFTSATGKPLRHSLFYRRVFKPTVRQVLPPDKQGLRFHDPRHRCASLSLAVSPNLHAVKERLGHEDIRTTFNTYGHLAPSVDAALTEGLDRLFASNSYPNTPERSGYRPG